MRFHRQQCHLRRLIPAQRMGRRHWIRAHWIHDRWAKTPALNPHCDVAGLYRSLHKCTEHIIKSIT